MQASEQELWTLFSPIGEILELYMLRNNQTGRSRGCAFVTFSSRTLAQKVKTSDRVHNLPRLFGVSEAYVRQLAVMEQPPADCAKSDPCRAAHNIAAVYNLAAVYDLAAVCNLAASSPAESNLFPSCSTSNPPVDNMLIALCSTILAGHHAAQWTTGWTRNAAPTRRQIC
jgi:hypothetical protein